MVKKGDTLVEVTLAVGIFSMIAVAVVAIMSNGTSNAQTALETTLARAEVDAQVEALRFIQQSVGSNDGFRGLWSSITEKAYTNNSSDNVPDEISKYKPTDCGGLYKDDLPANAFFIDVDELHTLTDASSGGAGDNTPENIIVWHTTGESTSSRLTTTPTYPQISPGGDEPSVAKGIFIVAVKDPGTVIIPKDINQDQIETTQSFYDFYVHTCWNSSNSDHPSTVSTVIRLVGE